MMRIAIFLLVIAGAAHAQKTKRITSVNDSYPASSPDGQTLLFQSDRSGDAEIWSMKINGGELRKLTDSKGYDGNPSWSPDGKQVVFASARDKDLEVYIMNADGFSQKRLTETKGNDGHPHWYPDGSRIIFNSARTSDVQAKKIVDEIFSMRPDGSDVRQVTDLKSVSTFANVSPDGKKIVFRGSDATPAFAWDMTSRPEYSNSEIFVMDIDGKNIVNITRSPAFDGWPTWSPDSKKIVFASNRSGKPNAGQLYVCNADGSGFQQLTDLPGAVAQPWWNANGKAIYGYQLWETSEDQFGFVVAIPVYPDSAKIMAGTARPLTAVIDCYPVLSPDGKTIAFHSNRGGDFEIYTVDAEGNNLKQLTNTHGTNVGPVWSPDGKLLAFASERDDNSEIYVMNADGSMQRRLTDAPGDDSHPHWFPDGSRILFNSARNTPGPAKEWSLQYHDVYSITVDGKTIERYTDNRTVTTYPSVSPDGTMFAFRKVTDTPAINWDMTLNTRGRNSEVFVMNIATKQQINLSSHFAFDGWPAWTSDSKSVIFASNRNGRFAGGQLFISDLKGNLRQLTDLPGAITQHSISADGKYIFAYQCFETLDWEYGQIVRIEMR